MRACAVTVLALVLGCTPAGVTHDDPLLSGPGTGGDPTTGPADPTTGGQGSTGPTSDPGTSSTGVADGESGQIKLDVGAPSDDVPAPPPEGCGQLVATVRDFSQGHPDFETYTGDAASTGLVLPSLGGDGNPVLDPAYAGGPMITSVQSFSQWYQDVPGTNHTFEVELQLTDEGTGELVFDSAAFFPIDGFGFGNEGNPNNFHFTTEVNTSFTYEGGEVFSFRGDDDIWVFVDGELALDLGGLHPPLEAAIDMDALGLIVGQTYPMDIFHAERHTDQSNFRIVTTIACFEPPR